MNCLSGPQRADKIKSGGILWEERPNVCVVCVCVSMCVSVCFCVVMKSITEEKKVR